VKDPERAERISDRKQRRNERTKVIRQILEGFLSERASIEEFRERSRKESANNNCWGFIGRRQILLKELDELADYVVNERLRSCG
jgi:hypothetical protein